MKILHVIPSIASVRGGPSLAILQMVRALRQQGIEVEIATTNDNGDQVLDVPLQEKIYYHDVPVWFFPRFSPKQSAIREFAFSLPLTQWLYANIGNYDLLHVHAIFSYPSTIAMLIARRRSLPYIIRPLGQLCHWSLQQSTQKKKIYLNLIERSNLDNCQALHVTSNQEESEISSLKLRCPCFVTPHGLQMPDLLPDAYQKLREHFSLPPDEPVVLFLSRLHPKKGIEYLIQSLAKLHDQRFTFVIAGNGDQLYEAQIQQCLQKYDLQDRTILTGFVSGELKQLLLQGSDLFALTSHSENFGIAVLEALAAGTPVLLTSGVALAAEVQQHTLGYVLPQDVDAIADALMTHLQLPKQQQVILSQKAQKFVLENYTWAKIATNLIEVYQLVLQQVPLPQRLLTPRPAQTDG